MIYLSHGFRSQDFSNFCVPNGLYAIQFGQKHRMGNSELMRLQPSSKVSIYNNADVLIFRGAVKNFFLPICYIDAARALNLLKETPKISSIKCGVISIEGNNICLPRSYQDDTIELLMKTYLMMTLLEI